MLTIIQQGKLRELQLHSTLWMKQCWMKNQTIEDYIHYDCIGIYIHYRKYYIIYTYLINYKKHKGRLNTKFRILILPRVSKGMWLAERKSKFTGVGSVLVFMLNSGTRCLSYSIWSAITQYYRICGL